MSIGTIAAIIGAVSAFSGASSGGDSTGGGGGMDIGTSKSSGSGFIDVFKSGLGAYNKMRGRDAQPFSTQESRPSISSSSSNYYDRFVNKDGQRSNSNMQPNKYQPVYQRVETVIRNLQDRATNDQVRQLLTENMMVQPNKQVGAVRTATGPSTLGALKTGV